MSPSPALAAVVAALTLAGCVGTAALPPTAAPAGGVTARITHIDVNHGYLVAEWPAGGGAISSAIMMDKRALGVYRVGDSIVLDASLRPQGRS